MCCKTFSQNIDSLFEILSKIVVKKLEIMFMVPAFPKICTAWHTDENGIEPGSNLNTADKLVAEPYRAEFFFFFFLNKMIYIQYLNDSYKNVSRIFSRFGKIGIFLYSRQVKLYWQAWNFGHIFLCFQDSLCLVKLYYDIRKKPWL